ncbi:hypothetical protein BX666DRAFT_2032442 [Dichotomocladium elegans]|nr:hypothetical protein BX666DRAFT_2032442 [Dichotomocladium elegans]
MVLTSLIAAIEDHVAFLGSKGCDLASLWQIMQNAGVDKHDYCEILQNITSLSYYKGDQQVKKPTRFDETIDLRVIASPELRKKVLTRELTVGHHLSSIEMTHVDSAKQDKSITDNQFLILEKVAQTKEEGAFQVQIGKELGIDARSVYWAVKGLEKLKLIVKRRTATNSTWTNMIYHVRFAPKNDDLIDREDSIDYNTMQKRLVDTLSNARSNTMALSELLSSFNFTDLHQQQWGRRFIERAIGEGYVTKLDLISEGRKIVGIRLVGLPRQEAASTPDTETGKEDKIAKKPYSLKGRALQKKITSCIHDSGEKGITGREIMELLPDGHPGAIKRFLHAAIRAESDREIYNVIEPFGRSRLYRYFGRHGFEKFTQHHEDTVTPDEDVQVDGSKRKRLSEADDKSYSSVKRTKIINAHTADRKRKERSDDDSSNFTDDAGPSASPVLGGEFVSRTRQSMKGPNIIMDKRKQSMVAIIHRDKVRELNSSLGAEISLLAGEPPRKPAVARITWMRMAEALQKTNTIKVVKSLVPTFGGGTEYKILFLHPDLNEDDETVRQYLDRLRMEKVVKPATPKKPSSVTICDEPLSTGRSQDTMTYQQASNDIAYVMPEKFWREVALRHGWISSKWLRAKALHEHLFRQCNEGRTLDLGHVIKNLPLGIFCQTLGISRFHREIEEFMRHNNDLSVPLAQIPDEVRRKMIPPNSLFRKRLMKLIDLLEALELIQAIPNRANIRALRLADSGKIRNFSEHSRPVVQEIQLNSMGDVHVFWKELQFTCTCLYPKKAEDRNVATATDLLGSICLPHTWNTSTSLTLEQRKTLESFVDRSQKTAPSDDEQLIHHIAHELCLHPARIKRYFEGIMRIMRAKMCETISSTATSDATVLSQNLVEPTFAPTRKFLKHRFQAPDSAIATAQPLRRQKQEWSNTEDDVLLHCYAILSHRAFLLQRPLTWKPVLALLPGRDTEQYRRRLHHLRRTNVFLVERLCQQWREIYDEAKRSGKLADERPWDMFNFDLAGQLEYFVTRLSRFKSAPDLSSTRCEFEDQYDIVPDIVQRQMWIPQVVRADPGWGTTQKGSLKRRDIELAIVSIIIKMSLLAPSDDYDPQDAYALFNRFPSNTVQKAMEKMRKEGLLMRWRRQGNIRLIPGRMFNFSEKFLKKFSSAYFPHNLLRKAVNFYSQCRDDVHFADNQYTHGVMVVMLDMLSSDQISLIFDGEDGYNELRRSPYYPQLIHGFNVRMHYEQEKCLPIVDATDEQGTVSLSNEADRVPGSMRTIYDAIDSFGQEGCTLFLLKNYIGIPEMSIVDVVEALISKSLVFRVGISDIRLVTVTHASEWLAATKDDIYIKPRMWIDVKGRVISKVLQGCANAVIERIMKHPGITQAQLFEEFEGYMSSIEVYDLLSFLERNGAIKSKAFECKTSKVGLFDKRRPAMQSVDRPIIGRYQTAIFGLNLQQGIKNIISERH